jgi:CHAT domain-containing protein
LRFLCLALTACALAQQQPDAGQVLALGRDLVSKLTLQQDADAALFRDVGFDRAQTLLVAVMSHGQERSATAADWENLHRATQGLVELAIAKGELFRAAAFASFQDMFYRNFEHDYEAALKAAQMALDLHQKANMSDSVDLAWASVGRDYLSLGRPEEALRHFQEAHRITRFPTRKLTGQNWRNIVLAEIALKQMGEAQRELDRFLDAARSSPANFRSEALMAQSDLLMEQGKFNEALNVIKAAREAMKADPDAEPFDYEIVNQLMSCVLASMNNIPYTEALALAKRMAGEFGELPINLPAFAREAMLMRRRLAGEIDAVLREYTAELEAARKTGSVGAQIEILRRVGTSYRASNSIQNQVTALEQALELEKTMLTAEGLPSNDANAYSYFRILNSLGEAYLDLREVGKARRCFEEVTKKIEALPDATAKQRQASLYGEAVLGKVRVAELDDDPDTARKLLEQALSPKAHQPGKLARDQVLLYGARLERNLGEKPALAAQYYEDAIRTLSEKKDIDSLIAARIEYAHFLNVQGARVPDAIRIAGEQLTLAARLAQTINFADARWRVNYESGIVAEARGETTTAIEQYKKAIARLDEIRAGLSQQEQRQSLLDNDVVQDLYRRLIALLSARGNHVEAWRYVEQAKARSFLEILNGRRFRQGGDTAALLQIADLEQRIINLRVQLTPENEKVLRDAGREPALLKSDLRQLEQRFTFARQQAELGKTRSGHSLAIDPISLAQARRLLPAGTALIEYALLNDRIIVFLATAETSRQLVWRADTAGLRQNLLRLRSLLADPASRADLKGLVEKLSDVLIAPVAQALPKTAKRLLIVPSGVLNYLPFQVLTTPNGRPLIERFAITYLPSASSLQFLEQGSKIPADLFLGALGSVPVGGSPALPGTIEEVDGIAKVYPNAVRVVGQSFTHDQARQALLTHAQVHFATHGSLDEQAPLFSALFTAPAAGQPSRLSLYELTDMPLRARLVVLSACQTAMGKLLGGDEVSGLTRTFLLAGANTVVSSLWKVSDESTAILMQAAYRHLRAGETPGDALRLAALEVRKHYPHPFYWAPFIVTGVR